MVAVVSMPRLGKTQVSRHLGLGGIETDAITAVCGYCSTAMVIATAIDISSVGVMDKNAVYRSFWALSVGFLVTSDL